MYVWLLLLGIIPFTHAYISDDRDNLIQYAPPEKWKRHYAPDEHSDWPLIYQRTFTFSDNCMPSDHCTVRIAFKGSGITLYNVIRFPLNVTATIDGIPSQSYLHNLFSCDVPDPELNLPTCYEQPTINLQCLEYGNHVLELALVGYNSSQSDFYLDSVDVNESKSRCGRKRGLQKNSQIAIGVSVAAVALAGIAVLAWFHPRRRRCRYPLIHPVTPSSHDRICSFHIDEPLQPQQSDVLRAGHPATHVDPFPPAPAPTSFRPCSNTDYNISSSVYGGIMFDPVTRPRATSSHSPGNAIRMAKMSSGQPESNRRLPNQNVPLTGIMETTIRAPDRAGGTRPGGDRTPGMNHLPMYR